ncbi:MAG: prenyltransferase, partial [Crenarchaeota archaeon]|nr:prenyltransferase [Thermoproteota archaeon]
MRTVEAFKVLRIIRKHIVLGGFMAFSIGSLLAITTGGTFDLWKSAIFYFIALFGDLSTHFSNDYFDVETDRQVKHKKFFSGSQMLIKNPQLRSLVLKIALILLGASCIVAALATMFFSAPIELLTITIIGNFLGWIYSAPPIRLISRGLGEIAIAFAAGVVIPAVGYLSVKGQFDSLFAFFALPFMLYGYMLGLSLEAPDIETDKNTGKNNIGT